MEPANRRTFRVLFLCTGNSAAPIEKLERLVLEAQVQAIGEHGLAVGRVGLDEDAS